MLSTALHTHTGINNVTLIRLSVVASSNVATRALSSYRALNTQWTVDECHRSCFRYAASCCQPLLTCCAAPQGNLVLEASAYPVVRRNESIVEDHFGNRVADPYRALEDPDSEETIACAYSDSVSKTTSTNPTVVEAQNNLTRDVLAECATRDQFKDLLTQLYNYPRYSTPFRRGSRCVALWVLVGSL